MDTSRILGIRHTGMEETRRLGWAGHIIRMEDERIPKKVLSGKFHNIRPVGNPRTRKGDTVQTDTSLRHCPDGQIKDPRNMTYRDGGDEQKTENVESS